MSPHPKNLSPWDDTMLGTDEVLRMTGLSLATLNRMIQPEDGRFPKPMKLSERRRGWLARDVKAWLQALRDQSEAKAALALCRVDRTGLQLNQPNRKRTRKRKPA